MRDLPRGKWMERRWPGPARRRRERDWEEGNVLRQCSLHLFPHRVPRERLWGAARQVDPQHWDS